MQVNLRDIHVQEIYSHMQEDQKKIQEVEFSTRGSLKTIRLFARLCKKDVLWEEQRQCEEIGNFFEEPVKWKYKGRIIARDSKGDSLNNRINGKRSPRFIKSDDELSKEKIWLKTKTKALFFLIWDRRKR